MSILASHIRPKPVLHRRISSDRTVENKNFGLSAEEFVELSERLRAGDDTIFEKIFMAHFAQCRSFLANHQGLDPEAAYDATMDAILHFRQLIIEDKVKYGNLTYLLTLVAHQLYRKKQRSTIVTTAMGWLTEDPKEEEPVFSEDDYQGLSRAIAALGEECRKLLRRFYFDRRNLKVIAEEQGRTPVAVRKQKSRCMARLRNNYILTS